MQMFKRQPKRAGSDVLRVLAEIRACFEQFVKEYNDAVDEPALRFAIEEHAQASRTIVSNSYWVLSFCVEQDWIKAHLFRTSELLTSAKQETPVNLKMALHVVGNQMRLDGETIAANELPVLLLSLFESIVRRSQSVADFAPAPNTVLGKQSIATAVRQLIHERNSLLNELLTQNEAIHNNISREIHDQIISDLLQLKKAQSERGIPETEIETLEDAIAGLRDICTGLSSRDLKDWGLVPCLQNLVRKIQRKSEVEVVLEVVDEPPAYDFDVALQIFRIMQEALNNSLKHSGAKRIEVKLRREAEFHCFSVSDNGVFKNERRRTDGGSGMYIMNERTALINTGIPARLVVSDVDPTGTCVMLQVKAK